MAAQDPQAAPSLTTERMSLRPIVAWHAEHAKQAWQGRPLIRLTCERCGETFETRHSGECRWCSNRCKAAARRATRADHEDHTCAICEATYRADRYSTGRTCGRTCRMILSHRNRRGS